MTAKKPKGVFISWARLRRADTIAERLGIPSYTVKYFYRGTPPLLTLLKYALQSLKTFWLLVRDRPAVVLVTSPPVFAILPVYVYSVLFRARFAIDFHSGCFVEAHWRRWDWLHRFCARRATLNLVHNADNAKSMEPWGARHIVFPSLPPDLSAAGTAAAPRNELESNGKPRAVYICSFKSDEPVEAFLDAAKAVSEVDFFVTGKAPSGLESSLPPNVKLTGFLSDADYNELLAGQDLVIALTTRPGTLLYGAQEAIALAKPLVLSRTSTLETVFTGGAVFADNAPEALAAGIRSALDRRTELALAMRDFRARYVAEGEARLEEVRTKLGVGSARTPQGLAVGAKTTSIQ